MKKVINSMMARKMGKKKPKKSTPQPKKGTKKPKNPPRPWKLT